MEKEKELRKSAFTKEETLFHPIFVKKMKKSEAIDFIMNKIYNCKVANTTNFLVWRRPYEAF